MDGSSQAAVTPQGVRDGDPAVLSALVARRGPAVLAFCEAVCDPEIVPRAVAEAFARFRALVSTVDDVSGLDPEAFLLGATRHAAASMARVPTDGRGVLRALGRGTSPETYASVPSLLAARADSMLGAEDLERLSRLLERSPGCREVEAAFRRAERGYRSPPDRPLTDETTALIIATMHAAAPVADAFLDAVLPVPELPELQSDDGDDAGSDADTTAVVAPATDDAPGDLPDAEDDGPVDTGDDDPDRPAPFIIGEALEPEEEWPHDAVAPATSALAVPQPLDSVPIVDAVPLPGDIGPRSHHRVRRVPMPRLRVPHGGGLHLPRRPPTPDDAASTADHGPVYRLLLPAIAVLIAVLVMLAIAGVFGGGSPSPAAIVPQAVATQIPPTSVPATTGTVPTAVTATTTSAAAQAHRRALRKAAARRRAAARAVARLRAATTSTAAATSTVPATSTPAPSPRSPVASTPAAKAKTPTATKKTTVPDADQAGSAASLPGASSTGGTGDDESVYTPGSTPTTP